MKDQFNGKTEKRRPPPYLTGHELYKIANDGHVVLGKWKMTGNNVIPCVTKSLITFIRLFIKHLLSD
jgi:hypothetical protein